MFSWPSELSLHILDRLDPTFGAESSDYSWNRGSAKTRGPNHTLPWNDLGTSAMSKPASDIKVRVATQRQASEGARPLWQNMKSFVCALRCMPLLDHPSKNGDVPDLCPSSTRKPAADTLNSSGRFSLPVACIFIKKTFIRRSYFRSK